MKPPLHALEGPGEEPLCACCIAQSTQQEHHEANFTGPGELASC